MRKRIATFVATCGLLLFVGTGCETDATAQILTIIEDLMHSRGTAGIVAGGGKVKSGDTGSDALAEGADAVKAAQEADKMLDEAEKAMQKDPPDEETATMLSLEAALKRPKDRQVRSRRGVILTRMGRGTEAEKLLTTYADDCDPSKPLTAEQRERCRRLVMEEAAGLSRGVQGTSCRVIMQQIAAYERLEQYALQTNQFVNANMYKVTAEGLRSAAAKACPELR